MYARVVPFIRITFLLFVGLISSTAWSQDQRGEAKKSSEESMKKVDDGKPILTGNMMQHMMKAQMYRTQKNYSKAAEEDMKAQMLREQLRENQESRDKNEKRRDQAVYSSDAAQSQLKGTVQSSAMNSNSNYSYAPVSAAAAPSLSGLFAPVAPPPAEAAQTTTKVIDRLPSGLPTAVEEEISQEFIIFDEAAGGPAVKSASNGSFPETGVTDGTIGNAQETIASDEANLSADSIANFQQDLSRAENQMVAANAADFASQLPVRIGAEDAKRKKQKSEEDEAFWKTPPKKAEKEAKNRRSGRRRVASQPGN